MSPAPRVSGKKIVLAMAGLAALYWAVLFFSGLREKHRRVDEDGRPIAMDTAAGGAFSIFDSLPREWTRITKIEGQGWVVFVPCDSQPGILRVETDSLGRTALHCEFCDSLSDASPRNVERAADGRAHLDLGPQGQADIESVSDSMARRFAGTPVKGHVLTWRPSARDSLIFVPVADAAEFEMLRAEDENPEGCNPGGAPGPDGD